MRAVDGAGKSWAIGSSPTCAGQYGVLVAGEHARHPGGGFNPPEPTTKGGPDYGRFIEAVRTLQDHARAVDAPDAVISEAADLVEKVSDLLSPFDTDEWATPSVPNLVLETEPEPEDVRLLEHQHRLPQRGL